MMWKSSRPWTSCFPQYTFTYEITDKETMNVGVQSGTYQVGINSLFKNDARTATYYMPENNVGYTPVGIIHREGEEINSLTMLSIRD